MAAKFFRSAVLGLAAGSTQAAEHLWYNLHPMTMLPFLLCATLITNTVDLVSALHARQDGARFEITGNAACLLDPGSIGFVLADGIGLCEVFNRVEGYETFHLNEGAVVRARGVVRQVTSTIYSPDVSNIVFVSSGRASESAPSSIAEIKAGARDYQFIRLRGTVKDVFLDEIDSDWHYFILDDGHDLLYGAIYTGRDGSRFDPHAIRGSEVEVSGICHPQNLGSRGLAGPIFQIPDSKYLTVIRPAATDPFDVPLVKGSEYLSPEAVQTAGNRRFIGKVRAVWDRNRFLMQGTSAQFHTVELNDDRLPACGQWVEAAGTLETDLFQFNLSSAVWRDAEPHDLPDEPPIGMSTEQLLVDDKGNRALHHRSHGHTVRVTGVIVDKTSPDNSSPSLLLRGTSETIAVSADACPSVLETLAVGSTVAVTGTCILWTPNWTTYSRFPHTTVPFIALSAADGVEVLATPSWWTPTRLISAIGALIALLVVIVAWNRILNRLVNRRSRELFHEQVAHYGATLRIDERTRLAVELHDSISQVLTAVAMEIEAVRQTAPDARPETCLHLEIAQKTLGSCRAELRNCLWDLRNLALDEPDMNAAIRKTLLPHVKDIKTAIRFNIPRTRLSDNTTHAILQIVRELTVNAVKHGKATAVQIAGGIEGDLLKFSVTNDGAPFDLASCPGVTQGHFGLQGIRERLRRFDGLLSVSCSEERGVRVKVTMRITQPGAQKGNGL